MKSFWRSCRKNTKKIPRFIKLLKYQIHITDLEKKEPGATCIETWNYNTNRNNMQENSFRKVYWIQHGFGVERDSL